MITAGLDTGDRCWLVVRDSDGARKRIIHAQMIALGDVVAKAVATCERLKVECLFIDERPAVTEARTICMILNKLQSVTAWPKQTDWGSSNFSVGFPSLRWNGARKRWEGLKAAVVRFSKREIGDGIEQSAAEFTEANQTKFVPLVCCNRFETIDKSFRELLTPAENVVEVVNGKVRQEPALLLPRLESSPMCKVLDSHLLAGSAREREPNGELGDYVDAVENHFALANAYAALAETVCEQSKRVAVSFADIAAASGGTPKFTPSKL